MAARKRQRSEHTEQAILASRVHAFYPKVLVFAVPNGGWRDKREAARLKDEGVLAGVFDLVVLEARGGYHGALIEMKRADGGAGLSPEQARFRARARRNGYKTIVGNGADHAWRQLEEYLEHAPTDELPEAAQ